MPFALPAGVWLGYEGLKDAVRFLSKNHGYASTQGLYTQFFVDKLFRKVICRPGNYSFARNYNWGNDSYIARLMDINSYYIMHYCYSIVTYDVLNTFRTLVSSVDDSRLGHTLFEPLMAYAIAINGKVKTLGSFYCAREISDSPDWLGDKSFENFIVENSTDYKMIVNNIANECMRLHGGNKMNAIEIAEMAGKTYVESMLHRMNISKKSEKKSDSYFTVWIKFLKRILAALGITKSKGINLKFFSGDKASFLLYKHDWINIERDKNELYR